MIITLHEQRARGRQRLWWGAVKLVILLVVLAATFVVAHRLGRQAGGREVNGLRQEIAVLNETVEALQADAAAQAAAATTAPPAEGASTVSRQVEEDPLAGAALLDGLLARIAELEAAVAAGSGGGTQTAAASVPADIQELVPVLQAKLAEGVTLPRLRAGVEAISRERSCEPGADSRRFVVQTAARQDEANGSVTFTDGITVTAEGAVPENAEGRARLRFDPAQPVTVRFAVPEGAPSEVSGVLPLEHALVLGDKEHLFTAEPGDPGFLRITKRVCAYP